MGRYAIWNVGMKYGQGCPPPNAFKTETRRPVCPRKYNLEKHVQGSPPFKFQHWHHAPQLRVLVRGEDHHSRSPPPLHTHTHAHGIHTHAHTHTCTHTHAHTRAPEAWVLVGVEEHHVADRAVCERRAEDRDVVLCGPVAHRRGVVDLLRAGKN